MFDIALKPVDKKLTTFDLQLSHNDVVLDHSLATAVMLSLFSDRRVDQSKLPSSDDDPRGWWGDDVFKDNDYPLGSTLWLYQREKITPAILTHIEQAARDSLQWLIDDKKVQSVAVNANAVPPEKIHLHITLQLNQGIQQEFHYAL